MRYSYCLLLNPESTLETDFLKKPVLEEPACIRQALAE
jgi:hypothetical protein